MEKRLPPWLHSIERFVDEVIPYMLVLLTIFIVVEFTGVAEEYHSYIIWADYVIVSFFVIDLMFKWHHTPKLSKFVKLYWIDIIAVFPFYLLFRVYFVARELIGAGEQIQKVLHEAVLLRETKILRQAGITSTFAKEGRIVQAIARSLRILRARWYITHWHIQKVSKGYRKAH